MAVTEDRIGGKGGSLVKLGRYPTYESRVTCPRDWKFLGNKASKEPVSREFQSDRRNGCRNNCRTNHTREHNTKVKGRGDFYSAKTMEIQSFRLNPFVSRVKEKKQKEKCELSLDTGPSITILLTNRLSRRPV